MLPLGKVTVTVVFASAEPEIGDVVFTESSRTIGAV